MKCKKFRGSPSRSVIFPPGGAHRPEVLDRLDELILGADQDDHQLIGLKQALGERIDRLERDRLKALRAGADEVIA